MADCLCGCGRTTQGEFAPGHDARYKSQLLARLIDHDDSEALVILTKRKWTKFIEPARRQRKIKAARAMKREKRRIKQIIADDPQFMMDRIAVMKAAGCVLKQVGQYYRGRNHYSMTDWTDAMLILAGEHDNIIEEVGPEHWANIPREQLDAVGRLIYTDEVARLGMDFEPFIEWLVQEEAA